MKPFADDSIPQEAREACAVALLSTAPLVMQTLRLLLRRHHATDLSVPQLRVLAFLYYQSGSSLSDVAEHLGIGLPSTSKLIDGLCHRQLLHRHAAVRDRRRVILTLTPEGAALLARVHRTLRQELSQRLALLSRDELTALTRAMQHIRALLEAPAPPAGTTHTDEKAPS